MDRTGVFVCARRQVPGQNPVHRVSVPYHTYTAGCIDDADLRTPIASPIRLRLVTGHFLAVTKVLAGQCCLLRWSAPIMFCWASALESSRRAQKSAPLRRNCLGSNTENLCSFSTVGRVFRSLKEGAPDSSLVRSSKSHMSVLHRARPRTVPSKSTATAPKYPSHFVVIRALQLL